MSSYILECHIIHLLFTKAFCIIVQEVLFLEFVARKKNIFSRLGYNKNNGLKFVSSRHTGISLTFSLATLFFIIEWKTQSNSFSYPEPFLRAFDLARRGALAKSITGYHKNMVRKQYPASELANQMPVRIWIWPEPLVAPRVRRALGTRMSRIAFTTQRYDTPV